MNAKPAPWPGLDLAKALCALGMVLVHGIFWSWTSGGRVELDPSSFLFQVFRAGTVLGLLPIMLPTLGGIALAHRLGNPSHRPRVRLALTVSLTGVFLVACGMATNVLAVSWGMAKAWNVLQFVGLSFQLFALCLLVRSEVALAALAVVSLFLAGPLRIAYLEDFPPMWKAVLLGDPHDFHTWPLLPWFPTVVFGWFLGRAFGAATDRRAFAKRAAIFCGLLVLAMAPFGVLAPFDSDNIIGPAFMTPEAPRGVAIAALAGLLVAVSTLLRTDTAAPSSSVRIWSGGILPIYVVHMAVGNKLAMRMANSWDRDSLWRNPLSASAEARLWLLPAFLVALSWLTGWIFVRLFQDRRLVIRIRRAPAPVEAVP